MGELKEYVQKDKIFAVQYDGNPKNLPGEIKEKLKVDVLEIDFLGRLYFKNTTKKAVKGNMIVLVGDKIEIISSQRSFNKLFKEASK